MNPELVRCQIGEASRKIIGEPQTVTGFAACLLCEKQGFISVRTDIADGERPVIESSLVGSCESQEMQFYPEIQYRTHN